MTEGSRSQRQGSSAGTGAGWGKTAHPTALAARRALRFLDGAGVLLLAALGCCRRRRAPAKVETVAHVIDSLGLGGSQRQFLHLVQHRPQWSYCSLTDLEGVFEEELRRLGQPVHRLYRQFRRNVVVHGLAFLFPRTVGVLALVRWLRRQHPQCVWGWQFLANVVVAPAARLAGVPRVVVRVENLSAWKRWPPHRAWWNRPADRLAARLADAVVVNCHAAVADFMAWAGCPRGKIHVVPNGVDGEALRAAPWRDVREELAGPEQLPVVLTVGRLAPEKAQEVLLGAAARLWRQGVRHRLVLVGGGEREEFLRQLAAQLGLGDAVRFVGETRQPQSYYRSADVFALSSSIEGMPNALMEAQLFALPAVTTDAGGAAEVVKEGETGFVVPVGDEEAFAAALGRLLENGQLRRRLGEAGRRRMLEEFTFQRVLQQVAALSEGAEEP